MNLGVPLFEPKIPTYARITSHGRIENIVHGLNPNAYIKS